MWMRRDLRLEDNAALYHALRSGNKVLPIFIFDKNILGRLENKKDARVYFIYNVLKKLKERLQKLNSDLKVYYGNPEEIWIDILNKYEVTSVYVNRDYESYAIKRDNHIHSLLEKRLVKLLTFKDQVIFEGREVLKEDGNPYVVFTPYKRKWYDKLNSKGQYSQSYYAKSYPSEKYANNFLKINPQAMLGLDEIGFEETIISIPSATVNQKVIREYDQQRNFPAINGTSKLGIHFRFGTISIREKLRKAMKLSDVFTSELIWRDFYSQILQHFPHVEKNAFREKYERVDWLNNEDDFEKWCNGQTGYPLVDAGMRQLNQTGFMHNRVRMITASFLTKHLLIDWRWGEAYFASKLLDYDLASNNGGWQWAAGCGTDAAPYFRIFNPETQMKKFDPNLIYIKEYIPEFGTSNYPEPMVDHKKARERCLTVYKKALI